MTDNVVNEIIHPIEFDTLGWIIFLWNDSIARINSPNVNTSISTSNIVIPY